MSCAQTALYWTISDIHRAFGARSTASFCDRYAERNPVLPAPHQRLCATESQLQGTCGTPAAASGEDEATQAPAELPAFRRCDRVGQVSRDKYDAFEQMHSASSTSSSNDPVDPDRNALLAGAPLRRSSGGPDVVLCRDRRD